MTAAHPPLPIPSYARVTNLANGKQVIVRVNDRGPFHSKRIIDLSFTAALKLGYLGKGSGELEVERLLPDEIARINASRKEQPEAAQLAQASAPVEDAKPAGISSVPAAQAGDGIAVDVLPVANAATALSVVVAFACGFFLLFGAFLFVFF